MVNIIENDRFADYVGIRLVKAEPGYALAELEVSEKHLNGVDMVQGGAIFTLADYAFAAAVNSKTPVTVAVQASISFFKSPRGRLLKAEARELASSRKICGCNVDVFDEDGELVARFSGMGYIKTQA